MREAVGYRFGLELMLPSIGLGTRLLLGETCADVVVRAVEAGYRYIDTAPAYDNEAAVGEGLRRSSLPRDEVFVTTKVERQDLRPEALIASVSRSLDALRLDQVDLLLIHWPDRDVPLVETLSAMRDLQGAGRIRHMGLANFPVVWLDEALDTAGRLGTTLLANQIEIHPSLPQAGVVEACRARGVRAIAYSPMGRDDLAHDHVLAVARRRSRSPAQVVLRWHFQRGIFPVPIPDTGQTRQIVEQFSILDFELQPGDMAELSDVRPPRRYFEPPWAPIWDPQD